MVSSCGKNIVLIKGLLFTVKYFESWDTFFEEQEGVRDRFNYGQGDNNCLASPVAGGICKC